MTSEMKELIELAEEVDGVVHQSPSDFEASILSDLYTSSMTSNGEWSQTPNVWGF